MRAELIAAGDSARRWKPPSVLEEAAGGRLGTSALRREPLETGAALRGLPNGVVKRLAV